MREKWEDPKSMDSSEAQSAKVQLRSWSLGAFTPDKSRVFREEQPLKVDVNPLKLWESRRGRSMDSRDVHVDYA